MIIKEWWCISSADFLHIGGLNTGDVVVHLLVHRLQLICVLLQLHKLLLQGIQVVHGI